LGNTVPLKPVDNRIKLEILLDRTSIEIYANDGKTVISNCFTPEGGYEDIELFSNGGELEVVKMDIYKMKSIWRD
jgi:fructan beta-fructosidase